jgi:hypothetical protein
VPAPELLFAIRLSISAFVYTVDASALISCKSINAFAITYSFALISATVT